MSPPLLGELELATLITVARLGERGYGAEVRRELAERLGRELSVGAVYTTLQRLEDKGFLASYASEPRAERGGRSRRLFRVTTLGERACVEARDRSKRLWSGLRLRWKAS